MKRKENTQKEDGASSCKAPDNIAAKKAKSGDLSKDPATVDINSELQQQALLPTVKDPKLWCVKCKGSHERETAIRLMQRYIEKSTLKILSVIALDNLKNFIYVEAMAESHVREALRGIPNVFSSKISMVPLNEMPQVLSLDKMTQSSEGAGSSTLTESPNSRFTIGDRVIVTGGDLQHLRGVVQKFDGNKVYIKPNSKGLANTVPINDVHLRKFFETGDKVIIISGDKQGECGMVITLDGNDVIIFSDSSKDEVRVSANHVALS